MRNLYLLRMRKHNYSTGGSLLICLPAIIYMTVYNVLLYMICTRALRLIRRFGVSY